MDNALLVNYEYCFGCHSCEVACKKSHNLPLGEWGIKVQETTPQKLENGRWMWDFVPYITEKCDFCADRVKEGKKPSCVQHCLAFCIEYGTIEEMVKRLGEVKGKCEILIPR
ncbi:4Fe-4S dicluster domain-containing protein [Adlercreutzia sp. ZJ304]|uniref:4Fe-4S dicluster domain-containing protein n=1 Tax=Adlercreutzia sp. ZJ304 TaxID=2709791 RepID=UPI0013EBD47D|nr:4Fe-4S dicluster domain-containing protein [Adlercreutzia sp. ZJ304]